MLNIYKYWDAKSAFPFGTLRMKRREKKKGLGYNFRYIDDKGCIFFFFPFLKVKNFSIGGKEGKAARLNLDYREIYNTPRQRILYQTCCIKFVKFSN